MTTNDVTAPDRTGHPAPSEPNDTLRAQLLRVLDAADTVGLQLRSINTGTASWFVASPSRDGWSLEQARSLAAALDAPIVGTSTTPNGCDFLNVRLDDWATLHIDVEKQVAGTASRAAALTLGQLAGWGTPPAWMDPTAVRDAYRDARHRVTTRADLIALGDAAQTLGIHDDTH